MLTTRLDSVSACAILTETAKRCYQPEADMTDLPDFERFKQYYKLIERMVEEVDKETLIEAARILAMNVAHYRSKYGGASARGKHCVTSCRNHQR